MRHNSATDSHIWHTVARTDATGAIRQEPTLESFCDCGARLVRYFVGPDNGTLASTELTLADGTVISAAGIDSD